MGIPMRMVIVIKYMVAFQKSAADDWVFIYRESQPVGETSFLWGMVGSGRTPLQ